MTATLQSDEVILRAKNHLKRGEISMAIELLRSLMVLGIDEPRVLEALGVAYSLAGDSEWATSLLNRTIAQSPQRVSAYVNLGAHLTRIGDYQAAVQCLQEGLQITQQSADVFQNLGIAYQELKDWGRAQAAFREAIRLKPDFVAAIHRLAQVMWQSNNVSVATTYFRKVLELDPQHTRARRALDAIMNNSQARSRAPLSAPVPTVASPIELQTEVVPIDPKAASIATSLDRRRPRSANHVSDVKFMAHDLVVQTAKLIEWFDNTGADTFSQFRKHVANGVSERPAFQKAHSEVVTQTRVAAEQYRRFQTSFRRLYDLDRQ